MKINKNSLQARIKNLSSQKGVPSNVILQKNKKNTHFFVRVSTIEDAIKCRYTDIKESH